MKNICILPLFCALFCAKIAFANVNPAHIFGSHMVLQRDKPIKVWGWADAGEKVTVQWRATKKAAKAGLDGRWEVLFNAEPAGGPYTMTLLGKDTVVFDDVLVGEVWVCSGQSNMEWILADAADAEAEIAAANYPQIRHIKVAHQTSLSPERDIEQADWDVCNPETAGQFSAVAYHFAKKLFEETGIPVGLINSSWGGTHCETWTSRTAVQNNPEFAETAASLPVSSDAFEALILGRINQLVDKFQGPANPGESADGWETATFDDSGWQNIYNPKAWEAQGLEGFDGVVWMRKTITLSEAQAQQPATLQLGVIDDCDSTYVNGQKIGVTCMWNQPRIYPLPAGVLKAGPNVIAVKVIDWGGGGGLYDRDNQVKLLLGADSISLAGTWKARVDRQAIKAQMDPNSMPTLLFNGMISPLLSLGIKGVIWYQGESNAPRAEQYARSFPRLIQDWRAQFNQGDFPFYFVQLASFLPYDYGNLLGSLLGSEWAELRDAQRQTLALPHTGMAVTIDIGDAHDIHPRNKKDVGLRLARQALKYDYGRNIETSGPMYKSMEIKGSRIEISFDHAESGLVAHNKYGYLFGFSVAGADQVFHWAIAYIKDNKVTVYNDEVPNPVAVRYGWVDNPEDANLFNQEGLPAAPFRSDSWKLITADKKFR